MALYGTEGADGTVVGVGDTVWTARRLTGPGIQYGTECRAIDTDREHGAFVEIDGRMPEWLAARHLTHKPPRWAKEGE